MRIESFWAKGFRSLRDVHLKEKDLGAFNVFYGPNGSGKSNILDAIRVLFAISGHEKHIHPKDESCSELVGSVIDGGVIKRRDLHALGDARKIVLGAKFSNGVAGPPVLASEHLTLTDLTVEYTLEWIVKRDPKIFLSKLESEGKDLRASLAGEPLEHLRSLLTETLPLRAYTFVGADRFPRQETRIFPKDDEEEDAVFWHLRHERLKNAVLTMHISPDPAVRRRLGEFRALMSGPPLNRPPFDPVQDPKTNAVELHERLPDPNPDGLEIPLDLAGLGIAQVYAILAQAMLSGASIVAIEEPEAHLHAPTTGLYLRTLLKRLVDEKHIDQLFIATHSNLFDLDPTGYCDVSLQNGETVVIGKKLDEIDQHLYEPGPTRHALEELLAMHEKDDPDRIMFRYAGQPVSLREMLSMLRTGNEIALDYLEDLHRAAVDVVGLRARRKAPKAAP